MTRSILIGGDVVTLAVVTLIGFASHGELGVSFLSRMGASFIPLCIAWFLLSPSFGLFRAATSQSAAELWRPAFVMLFAGPLAALLRGIVLAAPVIPSFAVVLSLTAALALTAWRSLWCRLQRRAAG